MATTTSSAKIHHTELSGHIIINSSNKISPSSSSPSGQNNTSNDRGKGGGMEILKNSGDDEDARSGDEEQCIFRSPPTAITTASLISRKRVRLQGKVSEGCNAVDLAVVPRRLRSAMNKRAGHTASPPLLPPLELNTQLPLVNVVRRFKQRMLLDSITKEEEEVAEILASLASLIVSKPIEEDRRVSEVMLLPCTTTKAAKPSSLVEQSPEEIEKGDDPCIKAQSIAGSASLKFDLESNGTAQPDLQRAIASKIELAEGTCSGDAVKSAKPQGSSQFYCRNGVFQPIQFDSLRPSEPEIGLCCSRFGSALGEQGLQSVEQNLGGREETTPDGRLLNHGHGHSTTSSSKVGGRPDSVIGAGRPNSTGNELPTKKLPPVPPKRKLSWKRCTAHVYISHLIQNHQKGRSSGVQALNEPDGLRDGRNSLTTRGSNGPAIERNIHEAPQERMVLQSQQASTSYSQQKQIFDFLSLSASGDPGNGGKPSGQHHVTYLHSQGPPQHSIIPFPFPHVPYTSPYPDQLAAAANQQVQLHLPHYIGYPFYGQQHMVHAGGGTTKHQQQMWHVAHYRPPLGIPKCPNASPSLLPLHIPSLPSSSRAKQQQQQQHHHHHHQHHHHHGPEGPPLLQLLCRAEHI